MHLLKIISNKRGRLEKYFRILIIAATLLLIIFNFFTGFVSVMAQLSRPAASDPSIEFSGLKEKLAGVRQAGFLSESESSAEGNDGRFLLAQYALAPTILDLNNPDHRYSILSCATPQAAIGIMKMIGAKPVHVNLFGKILAERSP